MLRSLFGLAHLAALVEKRAAQGVTLRTYRPLRLLLCAEFTVGVALLLFLPVLCPAQQHHLSYSASTSYTLQAVNAASQSCMATYQELVKINEDGSQAYKAEIPSTLALINGGATAIAIDPGGNCYLAGGDMGGSGEHKSWILKYNSTGSLVAGFNPLILPGSGSVVTRVMAADANGNVYLAGNTSNQIDFPLIHPAQSTFAACFVMKIAADTSFVYSTYLGGTVNAFPVDFLNGMSIDSQGAAYVVGATQSSDFPTVSALIPTNPSLEGAGFLTKFSPTGAIVFSTYLGGSDGASAEAVVADAAGEAYVGGSGGPDFPLVPPLAQSTSATNGGGFLLKMKADGSALLFSTFFGQGSSVYASVVGVGLDGAGNVYMAGRIDCSPTFPSGTCTLTGPANFPVVSPLQQTFSGASTDLFVAELPGSGGAPLFSTILGGPNGESIIAGPLTGIFFAISPGFSVDAAGNIHLVTYVSPPPADAQMFGIGSQFPLINGDSEPYGAGTLFYNGASCCGTSFSSIIAPGAGAAFAVPNRLDFTATSPATIIPVGQTASLTAPLQIGNYGTTDVHISGIATDGDFTQTNNCPPTLAASSASTFCSISLTFAPTAPGTRTGTITINDDAGGPHVIQLINAKATNGASAQISPTSLSFGDVIVGQQRLLTLTLTNPSPGALNISHIVPSGDFDETTNCPPTLQQSFCEISVSFKPTATGIRTGTITITDSAPDSPQVIALTGNGIAAPPPTLAASGPGGDSQTVAAGLPATYTLSASGFTGTINFACSGAPTAAACAVNPASLSAPTSGPASVAVTVSTTARSTALLSERWRFTPRPIWLWLYTFAAAMAFLCFGLFARARFARTARLRPRRVLQTQVLAWAASVLLAAGCGGGSSSSGGGTTPPPVVGTPAGTYTLTVTATAGATSQHISLTLVVQ